MKHICTYYSLIALSLLPLCKLSAQELLVDTLDEFIFTSAIDEVSEVYSIDSIPLRGMTNCSLVESIRCSQALYVKDYGPGNIANLTLRGGTSQQLAVFWNGMPINSPSLGMTDISLLPSAFFGSAFVSPGSSSLLVGAGGLTGGLYLNSNAGSESPSISLDHALTPYLGASRTQVVISDRNGRISSRTAVLFNQADNEFKYMDSSSGAPTVRRRENTASQGLGVSNDLSISVSDKSDIDISFHYLNQDREIASPVGIPDREENQKDEVFRSSVSFKHILEKTVHQITAGTAIEDQAYSSMYLRSGILTKRFHIRYQSTTELNSTLLMTARIDHDHSSARVNSSRERVISESGLFLGLEKLWLERTKLNGGLRVELMNSAANPMTASLGIEHSLLRNENLSLRASASKNFRNPTLNDLYWPELGNPDLNPESSYSLDAGLRYSALGQVLSLTFFHNAIDDLILWVPSSDGNFRPTNVHRSLSRGLESRITLRKVILDDLDIAYTYTDSEIDRGDEQWRTNLYQPEHLMNVTAWERSGAFRLGFSMAYNSQVFSDFSGSANSILDEVILMDAHLEWIPKEDLSGMRFGLSLRNLRDKNFEFVKDRPIPGRHIQFHLKIDINEKHL